MWLVCERNYRFVHLKKSKKSHSAENESFSPLPIFINYKNPIAYTNTLPNITPYLVTLPNSLGFCLKPNRRLLITIEHENSKPRQSIKSEYQNTEKHPRALGYGGRPFSAVGSSRLAIAYLIMRVLLHHPPPQVISSLLLPEGFFFNCPNNEDFARN